MMKMFKPKGYSPLDIQQRARMLATYYTTGSLYKVAKAGDVELSRAKMFIDTMKSIRPVRYYRVKKTFAGFRVEHSIDMENWNLALECVPELLRHNLEKIMVESTDFNYFPIFVDRKE